MTLPKLTFRPEQDGYNIEHAVQVISVKLSGGQSRQRADVDKATGTVTAVWMLDLFDYGDFLQFWIEQTARGALPFLADLLLDFNLPVQYKCLAIPGSYKTSQVNGLTYRVSMQLEVSQAPAYFTGSYFFKTTNEIHTPSPVSFSGLGYVIGAAVQLIGAQVNDGVHPIVNLDGIYVISSFPTGSTIALTSPSSINPDWSKLVSYPSGTTGTITHCSTIAVDS